jgi:hypothetical protein
MEEELSELYKNANNYTEEELKQKEKDIIEHY